MTDAHAPAPPPDLSDQVARALAEDVGSGDLTAALVPATRSGRATVITREDAVLCGRPWVDEVFRQLDPSVRVEWAAAEGAAVAPGDLLCTIEGPARSLLTGERTALNFLSHLSGVASVTAEIASSIAAYRTRVVCTRKTTPGLRAVEKYAVRAGGGANHRFGLDDAILIKDNHIAIAGSVAEAVRRARAAAGHLMKIELEVDALDQLREGLGEGVDAVLLDNMTPAMLREAVGIVAGRATTEASGRITPATAPEIAATGVEVISVGWLTHSAPILDIGLDFEG